MLSDLNNNRAQKPSSSSDMTQVIDSIRAIVKALRDSGRDAEQKLGITSAQLYVLQELRRGPASINELAARTYTHQSSVSMVVARLVESRLVTRSSAKGDARKLSISLTSAGRNLIRRSPDAAQNRLIDALRAMSAAEVRSLAQQLGNLTAIMEEQEAEPEQQRKRSSSSMA